MAAFSETVRGGGKGPFLGASMRTELCVGHARLPSTMTTIDQSEHIEYTPVEDSGKWDPRRRRDVINDIWQVTRIGLVGAL